MVVAKGGGWWCQQTLRPTPGEFHEDYVVLCSCIVASYIVGNQPSSLRVLTAWSGKQNNAPRVLLCMSGWFWFALITAGERECKSCYVGFWSPKAKVWGSWSCRKQSEHKEVVAPRLTWNWVQPHKSADDRPESNWLTGDAKLNLSLHIVHTNILLRRDEWIPCIRCPLSKEAQLQNILICVGHTQIETWILSHQTGAVLWLAWGFIIHCIHVVDFNWKTLGFEVWLFAIRTVLKIKLHTCWLLIRAMPQL